jgi:hypothetical protein
MKTRFEDSIDRTIWEAHDLAAAAHVAEETEFDGCHIALFTFRARYAAARSNGLSLADATLHAQNEARAVRAELS